MPAHTCTHRHAHKHRSAAGTPKAPSWKRPPKAPKDQPATGLGQETASSRKRGQGSGLYPQGRWSLGWSRHDSPCVGAWSAHSPCREGRPGLCGLGDLTADVRRVPACCGREASGSDPAEATGLGGDPQPGAVKCLRGGSRSPRGALSSHCGTMYMRELLDSSPRSRSPWPAQEQAGGDT